MLVDSTADNPPEFMKKHLIFPIIFPNAPIVEALLDIRVELPKDIAFEKLESSFNFMKASFPGKKQSLTCHTGLTKSPTGELAIIPVSNVFNGFHFNSLDGTKVVQYRLDGFTFNKLKPYENWAKFRNEARSLWEKYLEIVKPLKIVRIALRYINQIEIPLPFKDFEEYILTLPKLAPKLSQQVVSSSFMQFTIQNRDIEASAIITQTMKKPTPVGKLPFILDIDAFKLQIFGENKQQMWDEFEKLRTFKNDIFFNTITEKTMDMFK